MAKKKQYQTSEEWLKQNKQYSAKTSSGSGYQTAEEWLNQNQARLTAQHNSVSRQLKYYREELRKKREIEEQKKRLSDTGFRANDVGHQTFKNELQNAEQGQKRAKYDFGTKTSGMLQDLAMEKVAEQIGKKTEGLFGLDVTDSFFQNLMGNGKKTAEQEQYAAFMLRDPDVTGNLTSEQLRTLKESALKYAEELEQSVVKMWVDAANRLEWQANLAGRQEKIKGYETESRDNPDFETVSGENSKKGSMDDLRLYNAWLSYGAQNGQTWEEFYAANNPKPSAQRSGQYNQTRRKANQILQGMMDDEAARAKDEYEAALRQYEKAEVNLYEVPDGDFDRVYEDYYAAEERLEAARRRAEQAERAAKETKEATRKSLIQYRYSDEEEKQPEQKAPEIPEIGNKLEFFLANQKEGSDYGNLPDDVSQLMQYGQNNMWDRATEEQRKTYAYLLGTDEEKAEDYLKSLQIGWSREAQNEYINALQNTWKDESVWQKTVGNIGSVGANVFGSLFSGVDTISGMITKDINPYSQARWGQQYAGTVRELTSNDIYKAVGYDENSGKKPNFLQNAVVNGYNALMSAGDSALGLLFLGKGYTATMGSGAAAQKAQELYERGASDKELMAGAAMAGAFETIFEYVSLDKIIKSQGKNFLISALKSAGVEASEEVFTELANQGAEALMFGANSDTKDRENKYIAEGFSPEEAKKKAIADAAVDVFWAGYGGLISGGAFSLSGVPGEVARKVQEKNQENQQYRQTGKTIIENQGEQALLDAAKESGVEGKLLQLAKEKAAVTFENMKKWQQGQVEKVMGKLYDATVKAQQEKTEAAVRESFQKSAEDKITQMVEQSAQEAEQNAGETNGEDALQVEAKSAAEALTKAAYGEALTPEEQKTVEQIGGETLIEEIANSREFQDEIQDKVYDFGRTMALSSDESNPLNPKNVAEQRAIVQEAAQEFHDPEAVMDVYKDGQNAEDFLRGYRAAYNNGSYGLVETYSTNSRLTTALTRKQILQAHQAGRKAAGYEENSVRQGEKWNDRQNPGRQAQAVAEGAGAGQGSKAAAEPATAGGTGKAAAGRVSARELGITGGTDEQNLIVRNAAEYSQDEQETVQIAREHGLECIIVQGGAIKTGATVAGQPVLVKSRAVIEGNKMVVRSDDPLVSAAQIAAHEAAHKQIENGEVSIGDVVRKLREKYSTARIKEIIRLYADAYGNSGMNAKQVLEEIVCDAMGEMNTFATESTKSLAGEVGVFLRNVRTAAQNYQGTGTKKAAGDGSVIHYSRELEYDPETAGIKDQIRNSADVLNEMEPADNLVVPENMKEKRTAEKWAIDILKKTGYAVQRNGYGTIYFNEKDIRKAMNYCDTPEEKAAIAALPKVLKKGIEIGGHQNHKNRDKRTITLASPVVLNGKRGNMGVVVNQNGNHYYTHRIIMPDGSAFVFENRNDAAQEPYRGVTTKGSLASTTSAASTDKVAQDGADVKKKYSREMDTVKALERQNELLKQRVEYWKGQTKRTTKQKADSAEVRKLARELLGRYDSGTKATEILNDLQWLADQWANGGSTADYSDMMDCANRIARSVLEGSGVDVNADMAETRKELRQYLRTTPINVTDTIKADIGDFGDWKKRNRALRFREDGSGTDVDSMWIDLQDRFGVGMFPESVMNPSDQVMYIADKLSSMEADIQNPYQADMELAVQQLTMDIMNSAQELNPEKPTKADAAVERATEELRQLLEAGRTRENERIKNAKQAELRQRIRGIREKFQRMATKPGKGISQHAPASLSKAVVDFCEMFNESELRRMERWKNSIQNRADRLAKRMGNPLVTKTMMEEYRNIETAQERMERTTAKLTRLKNAYAEMEKDGQYQTVYDKAVLDMIDGLSKTLDGKDIYQLDTRELQQVQNTMSALYYTITNANKAFSMGKDKNIIDMAKKWAGEIKQVNHRMSGMNVLGRRFFMWQMNPDNFFNYTCGYIKGNEGKVIQDGFRRGEERMIEVQRDFYEMFREFTETQNKAEDKELRKLMNENSKRLVFWGLKDLDGNDVQTTRGMMLQACMMLQQRDSFESLQFGGFSIPNAEQYYKGNIQAAYGDAAESSMLSQAVGSGYSEMANQQKELRAQIEALQQKVEMAAGQKVAEKYRQEIQQLEQQIQDNQRQMEDMANQAAEKLYNIQKAIEQQLTPLEKRLIDKAHEWYSHTGELMKDVFVQMYGFEPKLQENYVPIHRDTSTIKTDIRDMAGAEKAFNLENSGFTIDRVKNYQPILLTDFFQELLSQKEKMSRYVGFAQVQKDFGKIWKTRISGSGMTINTLIRAKFGAGASGLGVSGEEYINNYIADVAGGHKSEDILSGFYGNYAAATLRFNPRVAVSQAASIPTAAAVVGWKSMAKGFAKGLPNAFSTKYRNELASRNAWFYQRYRGQGGSTELSEIRKKGNVIEHIADSKVGKKLFNWCQEIDVFSTGSIMWSAAEDYVQSQGLKQGQEGYEAAVNQVYTDIIRKSQPNYTTTERSDLLRDQRAHMKLLTMFKTQSNQNLNLLLEANGEFIRMRQDFKNGRNGVTQEDVKAAGKKLANASTGVLLGGTVAFVALRTMMNFIMGAVNPYRDKDTNEVTLEETVAGIGKEMISSIAGMVALGGNIYDFVMPLISGDNYYGLSDSAVSSLSSMLESTFKVLQKGTEATENQIWKMVNSWCMAFGIPAGNAKKVIDMMLMYYNDIQKGKFFRYESKDTTNNQYREQIVQHLLKGETDKVDEAMAMLFANSSKNTDEEIRKDVAQGVRTYLKGKYLVADVTELEAEKILDYTGTEDPAGTVAKWDFQMEYPEESNPSDALVEAYNKRGNIDGKVFLNAWKFAGEAQADKDKDGKTISGSKKEKIVEYIKNIPGLTFQQRKKLFELLNVGSIKGTPWE